MNREVFRKVAERSQGFCENPKCGKYGGESLHKHHSFNGSNRKKLEMEETVFNICMCCHKLLHDNSRELDLYFKKKATQNLLEIGWTKEQILKEVGRWYGDED